MIITNEIKASESGQRIDSVLSKKYPEHSRNYFYNLINDEKVLVNGKSVKNSYKLKKGDCLEINFINQKINELKAENIKLEIIYENDDVIVLNKQPGIVIHPAAGNKNGTLVNALLYHFPKIADSVYDKRNEISKTRPGIVHRLDKNTSGVLIVAKNTRSMRSLSKQINNRTVIKVYLALCYNWPQYENGEIINYLGRHPKNRKLIADVGPERGREAISFYKVIQYLTDKNGNKLSLVEFNIKTGRTHQIRNHAASIKIPVMGDFVYGNKSSVKLSYDLKITRQLLHAKKLSIKLPGDTKVTTFETYLPTDFVSTIDKLTRLK